MRLRSRFFVALVAAFLGAGSFGVTAHASTGKGGNGGSPHNTSSSIHSNQSNGGSKWSGNWENRDQGNRDHDRSRDHDRFRDHCCDHNNDHCCDNGNHDNSNDCDWLRNHDHDAWLRECQH